MCKQPLYGTKKNYLSLQSNEIYCKKTKKMKQYCRKPCIKAAEAI